MKRNALVLGLLVACGGNRAAPTETLGDTHTTAPEIGKGGSQPVPHDAKIDPALAARLAYSNPGGMWMPQQLALPGHVETFQKLGVAIPASQLSDPLAAPLNAVVSLGGCTASFVSPDGLLVTNHHCVQGALQLNSTEKENLVENGFLAKTRTDERSAGPAQRVLVAQAFTDVTKAMRDGLDAIKDPIARKEESEKRWKEQVAACEKDRPGIRCQVSAFFRGGQYILIENLELRDIRLVYAPARSIGNYGGEVDNWAWPRHTGDWSFYRAYVGKDGKPADFSPDNVPFKPKHFLKVSSTHLAPADFVMVAGYPGSTSRLDTALEVHHDVEWQYPYLIGFYNDRYKVAEDHAQDPGETGIKAVVAKQGVQNGLEKFQGVQKGLTSGDLLARKDALDKQVHEWAAKPGHEAYKVAIDKLEKILVAQQRTARVDFDRGVAFGGSRLLGTAMSLTRWAEERAKPDAERKPGYQERDLARAVAGQKQFAKQYDRVLDRANFRVALVRATLLADKDRPWLATLLGVKPGTKIDEALIDKTLDAWYQAQKLEDEQLRLDLLEKGTTAKLKVLKDPFVQAAQRAWPIVKSEEKKSDARTGELLLVTPSYADAMKEVLGGLLAPDANSTLRITYGTVKAFKAGSTDPADRPFTTASQIPTKNTGKNPFDAPAKLLAAIKAKQYGRYANPALGGELEVDFITDLDITGGNSGSAVLNDKGELVGLAFDGNIEGVASDVVFNSATTREISVSARYMAWVMDLIDGADNLLVEMGLTPSLP